MFSYTVSDMTSKKSIFSFFTASALSLALSVPAVAVAQQAASIPTHATRQGKNGAIIEVTENGVPNTEGYTASYKKLVNGRTVVTVDQSTGNGRHVTTSIQYNESGSAQDYVKTVITGIYENDDPANIVSITGEQTIYRDGKPQQTSPLNNLVQIVQYADSLGLEVEPDTSTSPAPP